MLHSSERKINPCNITHGHLGDGTLEITAGAGVSSTHGIIAYQPGSIGRASVTGAGSNWTLTRTLSVGGDAFFGDGIGGMGTLAVGRGAEVDVAEELALFETAVLEFDLADVTGHGQIVADSATLAGQLSVSLTDGFTPAAGNTFELLTTTGGVTGAFDGLDLPALASGLDWQVLYGDNVVTLSVVSTGLPGDYNGDGIVDAADYVVWRDNEGTDAVLANDLTPGDVSQDDYELWRANFGRMAAGDGNDVALFTAVPETATLVLLIFGGLNGLSWRRAVVWRPSRVGDFYCRLAIAGNG